MCVQCLAQLWGLRCATVCADMIQCSFACTSMLTLAKHCENSRETSSGCRVHDGSVFAAAPAPSLSCRHPPTWTSRHSNKDPPHFPSFPFPIPLPVHRCFLSTFSGFVLRGLDTCDSSVTHHTQPCNMYAEEGAEHSWGQS